MTAILALDLATSTGFAFWKDGMPRPMFGVITLPAPGGEHERSCLFLRRWLRDFHQVEGFTVGVFESPIMRPRRDKKATLRFLFGLATEAGTTMLELGMKAWETDHGDYMVHWTGSGDRRSEDGKTASLAAAKTKGWDCQGIHDVADALGLLDHWTHTHKVEVPWNNAPVLKLTSQRGNK